MKKLNDLKDLKVKVITGYRTDQHVTISAEEAPKAYYLFLNPDARTVFSNGQALRGVDIQKIEPDYNATMGWNPTHLLDSEDWNEIRSSGIDRDLRETLFLAKQVAERSPEKALLPLSEALLALPEMKNALLGD